MKDSHTLSDDAKEPVFIFQGVATAALVAWPFMAMLLGFTFGSIIAAGVIYAADRYLTVSRKKRAEEIQAMAVIYQRYVARCAKRFIWVRMISIAAVACFLKQPMGVIYFLFCGTISLAEVMWENSKLGDLEDKESIHPSAPARENNHR